MAARMMRSLRFMWVILLSISFFVFLFVRQMDMQRGESGDGKLQLVFACVIGLAKEAGEDIFSVFLG